MLSGEGACRSQGYLSLTRSTKSATKGQSNIGPGRRNVQLILQASGVGEASNDTGSDLQVERNNRQGEQA